MNFISVVSFISLKRPSGEWSIKYIHYITLTKTLTVNYVTQSIQYINFFCREFCFNKMIRISKSCFSSPEIIKLSTFSSSKYGWLNTLENNYGDYCYLTHDSFAMTFSRTWNTWNIHTQYKKQWRYVIVRVILSVNRSHFLTQPFDSIHQMHKWLATNNYYLCDN